MKTPSSNVRSIPIRVALATALSLCLLGGAQAEELTQAEMGDLRAELVARNAAQPSPGTFSAEELADLRQAARTLATRSDFGSSTARVRPLTEAELSDLRRLAHQHQLWRNGDLRAAN